MDYGGTLCTVVVGEVLSLMVLENFIKVNIGGKKD